MWTVQIVMTIASLKTWYKTTWTEESQWKNRLQNLRRILRNPSKHVRSSWTSAHSTAPLKAQGGVIICSIPWLVSVENLFQQVFGSILSQLKPSQQQSPTKPLTHLPSVHPSGMRERFERLIWENSVDWDKNSLTDKEKAAHTSRAE